MIDLRPDISVRPAAVAGLFYPADPQELRDNLSALLAKTTTAPAAGRMRALIAPHAGYIYSGPVAAEAFAALRKEKDWFSRVVVIAPAHRILIPGIVVPSATAFATPLGDLPIDLAGIADVRSLRGVQVDDEPHAAEHAIEVELPFLQAILGSIPIIPLLVGSTRAETVAGAIDQLWDDHTLVIVSSDLSHYLSYEEARRTDNATALAIENFNEAAIGPDDACGALPIRGLLIAARRRGFTIERLDLRNSGDTSGNRHSVVGYGAWVIQSQ